MKLAKISIIFIFLLAFVFQVLAQNETPKIVWKNLQEKYENFEDIEPHIELQNAKLVFWKFLPSNNLMFRFDEKEKKWIEGNYILNCAVGVIRDSLGFEEGKTLAWFFYSGQFFDRERGGKYFFRSLDRKKYAVNGKYKIRFYYGLEVDKIQEFSDSPEFFIIGK